MKLLIIPDIHNKVADAEAIIHRLAGQYDHVVFLGDFFDSKPDNLEVTRDTAEWIKGKINDPLYLFCHGNHDTGYRWRSHYHFTEHSGFSRAKCEVINEVLTPRDWSQFRAFHRFGNLFLSHAGISDDLLLHLEQIGLMEYTTDPEKIEVSLSPLFEKAHHDATIPVSYPSPLYGVSYRRGGSQEIGGVTWCDFSEFKPIPGIHQFFGHTRLEVVCATVHGEKPSIYYPGMSGKHAPASIHEAYESIGRGSGTGIDSYLSTVVIYDTDSKNADIFSCSYLNPDEYYDRTLTDIAKKWTIHLP